MHPHPKTPCNLPYRFQKRNENLNRKPIYHVFLICHEGTNRFNFSAYSCHDLFSISMSIIETDSSFPLTTVPNM